MGVTYPLILVGDDELHPIRPCIARHLLAPSGSPPRVAPAAFKQCSAAPAAPDSPSPAPRPGRARRHGPVACRRPTGLARREAWGASVRPGQACARRAAWGVRADPKRGHQREHSGRGWADGGG